MPVLGPGASKKAKRERMREEMHKFKRGELHSGSKTGPIVTDRDQAIAIGLHESGQSRKAKRVRRSKSRSSARR